MKRLFVLLAVPIALGLAGCARENNASIVPVGLCAPPTSSTGSCGQTASTCQSYLSGMLDFYLVANPSFAAASNFDLWYWVQYDNQLTDNSDASSGRTDTNGATVDGVSLSFSVHPSVMGAPSFSIPDTTASTIGGTIPAGGSGVPYMTIIPYTVVESLINSNAIAPGDAAIIDVSVRATGHLLDMSSFETGPLLVPVYVANYSFPGIACPSSGQSVVSQCPPEATTAATVSCQ